MKQTTMLVAGVCMVWALAAGQASAQNRPPTFFLGSGIIEENDFVSIATKGGIVVQDDGKILLGTHHKVWEESVLCQEPAILRYNPDGSPDTAFGDNGKVIEPWPLNFDNEPVRDIEVLDDGKIFLLTRKEDITGEWQQPFVFVRYNPDGSRDTNYFGDGVIDSTLLPSTYDGGENYCHGLTVQPDGKILLETDYRHPYDTEGDHRWELFRYPADAGPDIVSTFTPCLYTRWFPHGSNIAILDDGRIVITGYVYPDLGHYGEPGERDTALYCYNADGTQDSSFGTNGLARWGLSTHQDYGVALAQQSDGKILVFANVSEVPEEAAILRCDTNGVLDTSFGHNGIVSINDEFSSVRGSDFGIVPSGKLIASAVSEHTVSEGGFPATSMYPTLYCMNADGTPDATFGDNGKLVIGADEPFTAWECERVGYVVQPDGKILACASGSGYYWETPRLRRFHPDGTPDEHFGALTTNTLGGSVSYTEGGAPVVLDGDVQVYDCELSMSGDYSGSSLTLVRNGGASAVDVFDFNTDGALFSVNGGSLQTNDQTFATWDCSNGTLTVSFTNSSAVPVEALVDDVMQHICYANTGIDPAASVQIDWSFSDGGYGTNSASSATGSTTVAIATVPSVVITNPAANLRVDGSLSEYAVSGIHDSDCVGVLAWTNTGNATGGEWPAAGGQWQVDVPLAYGDNVITVSGTNIAGVVANDSVTITRAIDQHVGESPVHYVSLDSPLPVWPYTNWTTAAHIIQYAVDAASAGDTVLVTNGVYDAGGAATPSYTLTNRVCVTNAITLRSVNGWEHTTIVGEADPGTGANGPGAMRCVYLIHNAVLDGFTLTNGHTMASGGWNGDGGGGGVIQFSGSTVSNCLVTDCSAWQYGGGVNLFYGGTLERSIVTGNHCDKDGGGIAEIGHGGMVRNSLAVNNTASRYGGGAFGANWTLLNCTVASNTAASGGGIYSGTNTTFRNGIVYGNTGANHAGDIAFTYSCTTPDPGTEGCITDDPQFVDAGNGDYRLSAASLCIRAGTNEAWMSGAVDLQGHPRVLGYIVDMGAYEYSDPPGVVITNPASGTTVFGDSATIPLSGTNNPYVVGTMAWTNSANGANGQLVPPGAGWSVAGIPLVFGANTVTASGTNWAGEAASDSVTITRVTWHGGNSPLHYVSTNGAAVWPYTNWINAATSIQDAVDAAAAGDTVVATNGVYSTGARPTPGYLCNNRVVIERNISLRSVNGPELTFIMGQGPLGDSAVRCVYMSAGTLSGFTLTNGHARTSGDWVFDHDGGGLFLNQGGSVSNCTLTDNASDNQGGGAYFYAGGTLSNCRLIGNSCGNRGGAVSCSEGGTLNNCTLVGNSATHYGGGVYADEGTLNNCIVWGNSASLSGPDMFLSGGAIRYTCASDGITHGTDGCITNNPQFIDAPGGNYRLSYGSPCIDAGANGYAVGGMDLDDNARIVDGDFDGTNTVDMGAYEYDPVATDSDGDSATDYGEHVADTDPTDEDDVFRITGISNNSPVTVYFMSSSSRWYTMIGCSNLVNGVWTNVPGTGPREGAGGSDSLSDTNEPPHGPFYRLTVGVP